MTSAKQSRGNAKSTKLRSVLDAPFKGTEALRLGLLTRGQLYRTRFRRIFPDVYVPAGLELDLAARSRAAYLLVRDQGGVLAGYSAALLLGADCAPRNALAEVLVLRYLRAYPGLRVNYGATTPPERISISGCQLTTPLRTTWDLARRLPLVEAVVAVDALARVGAFAPAELLAWRAARSGARGCRRLDAVVELADPRAESPMETRLRLALVRAGLPRPEVQYTVRDEHGFVLARVDLAYPAAKLAIEYDGSTHYDRWRAELDRERDAILADYGWQTLRLTRNSVSIGMRRTISRVSGLLALRTPR